jgi:hypothetical protein
VAVQRRHRLPERIGPQDGVVPHLSAALTGERDRQPTLVGRVAGALHKAARCQALHDHRRCALRQSQVVSQPGQRHRLGGQVVQNLALVLTEAWRVLAVEYVPDPAVQYLETFRF